MIALEGNNQGLRYDQPIVAKVPEGQRSDMQKSAKGATRGGSTSSCVSDKLNMMLRKNKIIPEVPRGDS